MVEVSHLAGKGFTAWYRKFAAWLHQLHLLLEVGRLSNIVLLALNGI